MTCRPRLFDLKDREREREMRGDTVRSKGEKQTERERGGEDQGRTEGG